MHKNTKASNVVHVKINEPISKRKDILKTAISLTKMLYSYNELFSLRDKEKRLIGKYNIIHKEIMKLQKNLQDHDLPVLPGEKYEEVSEIDIPETSAVSDNDVNGLMQELKDVERKLKSLG